MFKRNLIGSLGLCLSAALAVACSAGTDEPSGETSSPVVYEVADGEKLLAQIATGYGHVLFIEASSPSGDVSVGIAQSTPVSYGETPVDAVLANGHTMLELFLAMQPGADVPGSLMRSHELEAKALGRDNLDLLPASYDPQAVIDKAGAADCGAVAMPAYSTGCEKYEYIFKRQSFERSGGSADSPYRLNVSTDEGIIYATRKPVTLAACNDSNATMKARMAYQYTGPGASGNWTPRGWATLTAGVKWTWKKVQYLNYGDCTGFACEAPSYPSYYRVEGYSPAGKKFYMVSGVYNVTQSCPPEIVR